MSDDLEIHRICPPENRVIPICSKVWGIYAYEVLTGVTNSLEYHQISKKEFDSFETWTQEYI
jgi:hypothetical protein